MLDFVFQSPTKFILQRGGEAAAGNELRALGGKKVLVHYGSESAVRSGLIDRVLKALSAAGLSFVTLGGVKPNPRSGLIREGVALCKEQGVDCILAVGGGSVIDSAKAIAAGVPYDGDFWDFYCGKATVNSALPIGVILTIAAAGSEGSSGSVVSLETESGFHKRDCLSGYLRPKFAILNPELTMTLPPYQTACGIVDIMAHVLERYFSDTEEVELTDRLCEAVLLTMLFEGPKVMKNPEDYGARANIMWAGSLAHNDLCGTGRAQDWASHMMEHELSALYDVAHGAGLAVIMPAFMEYVLTKHAPARQAQLAVRVFGCAPSADEMALAKEGIARFRRFIKSLGMPGNFEELGAKRADIPVLLEKLAIEGRTIGGFVPLDRAACEAVYTIAADAE